MVPFSWIAENLGHRKKFLGSQAPATDAHAPPSGPFGVQREMATLFTSAYTFRPGVSLRSAFAAGVILERRGRPMFNLTSTSDSDASIISGNAENLIERFSDHSFAPQDHKKQIPYTTY
jgi:hypothetical protein